MFMNIFSLAETNVYIYRYNKNLRHREPNPTAFLDVLIRSTIFYWYDTQLHKRQKRIRELQFNNERHANRSKSSFAIARYKSDDA